VLQVLPSSLLGGVFELVYHNARKQQILRIARIKCNFKVKTKRPSFAAPFWTHFEPHFEPLGWCALYSSATGRQNSLSWLISGDFNNKNTCSVMSAQMAVLGDLNLDSTSPPDLALLVWIKCLFAIGFVSESAGRLINQIVCVQFFLKFRIGSRQ
jgi:hypothetical protein